MAEKATNALLPAGLRDVLPPEAAQALFLAAFDKYRHAIAVAKIKPQ